MIVLSTVLMKLWLTLPQEMLNQTIDAKSTGKKNMVRIGLQRISRAQRGPVLPVLPVGVSQVAVENMAAKERANPR